MPPGRFRSASSRVDGDVQNQASKTSLWSPIVVVVSSVLELVFLPARCTVTPPDRIHALQLDTVNEVFADSVGWDDIAKQVTTIYDDLPASERRNTVIISAYYGVRGHSRSTTIQTTCPLRSVRS